jgi:hypothetical protein
MSRLALYGAFWLVVTALLFAAKAYAAPPLHQPAATLRMYGDVRPRHF